MNSGQRISFFDMLNYKKQWYKVHTQLVFLLKCRRYDVAPKCISINWKAFPACLRGALRNMEKSLLSKLIKLKRKSLAEVELQLYLAHLKFTQTCDPASLYLQLRKLQSIATSFAEKEINKSNRKLKWLLGSSGRQRKYPNSTPFYNYTGEQVPIQILKTIQRGPKFIPPPSGPSTSDMIPAALAALKNCQASTKFPNMELSVVSALTSQPQFTCTRGNYVNSHNVRCYLEANNLRLLILNKEKKFVLCKEKEKDFLNRATDFLNHSCAVLLQADPTSTVLRKVRKIISLPTISALPGRVDPPTNVACPRLFFEVKTHKEGWPLRPLVNKRTHPAFHLEIALAKLLSGLLPPSHLVTSSSVAAKTHISSVLDHIPQMPQFEAVMLANAMLIKKGFTAQEGPNISTATGSPDGFTTFSSFGGVDHEKHRVQDV
ncbi:uncharacterized protein LOC111620552 [Centruroides sculpturatus]|uniref:uncharacterized protein LOC111620552 n=1 Tax=Centruroides sculpturatus TaxID=218467 RepID=UPI000C6ECB73|nr:uncharacterized protein LOC111620552 [Centruroides sculpturatus]